jgi:hypothetical protein
MYLKWPIAVDATGEPIHFEMDHQPNALASVKVDFYEIQERLKLRSAEQGFIERLISYSRVVFCNHCEGTIVSPGSESGT